MYVMTFHNKLIRVFQKYYEKYNINLDVLNAKERLGDMKKNYTSSLKIKKNLGWLPKVKLEEGVKDTIDWYMNGR